jgi:hypothetical protein
LRIRKRMSSRCASIATRLFIELWISGVVP